MAPEQFPSLLCRRLAMMVGMASTLRLLHDLDNIIQDPEGRVILWVLYILFIIFCLTFLCNDTEAESPKEERNPGLVVHTEPVLAGVLAIGVYVFCKPLNASFTWLHGMTCWCVAAYLIERL